jgi:hypothetical protein
MTSVCPICKERFILPKLNDKQMREEAAIIWSGIKADKVIICDPCYQDCLILDAWERAGHMGERWAN